MNIPLLIVHGDVDTTVEVEQSRELVAALEAAGKEFEYIEQANGDHYYSLQSHRIEYLTALDRFLTKHLR
jgi:dipeptidyl aminopeptidase/acylaminoacyl peptidase